MPKNSVGAKARFLNSAGSLVSESEWVFNSLDATSFAVGTEYQAVSNGYYYALGITCGIEVAGQPYPSYWTFQTASIYKG